MTQTGIPWGYIPELVTERMNNLPKINQFNTYIKILNFTYIKFTAEKL